MKIGNIDVGFVQNADGARNFFGEGYWYSELVNWENSTFVTKTLTTFENHGNMEISSKNQPKKYIPDCIKPYPFKGMVLNAVGLSCPGSASLFIRPEFYQIRKPFILSWTAVKKNEGERLKEISEFCRFFRIFSFRFKSPVVLRLNLSCPNCKKINNYIDEAHRFLNILQQLDVPIDVKLSVITPWEIAKEIANHPACNALCISNTIPWGYELSSINWNSLSVNGKSPLAKYGGGGLSGKPLLNIVIDWISIYRDIYDNKTPITGGGGIFNLNDAMKVFNAGADSIFLGTVAMLRPWRVQKIIRGVNNAKKLSN